MRAYDLPQLDGIRWERIPGEYPDDERRRIESNPDISWPGIVLVLLSVPLFLAAEWWRRVRG